MVAAGWTMACRDDPSTGALVMSVNGLPPGAQANIEVEGPNQFSRTVTATTTLDGLVPGEYTVRPLTTIHSHAPFVPAVGEAAFQVSAGRTASTTVPYALAGGSIELAIAGLPTGTPANITLTGSNGIREVTSGGVIEGLTAGIYVLRADTAESAVGDRFSGGPFIQDVAVGSSLTPVPATVSYALTSGSIALTIEGLPGAPEPAPVTVAGPGNLIRRVAATTTLRGLPPGSYSITAATHHETCPLVYTPSQSQQTADVAIGATVDRSVVYAQGSVPPPTLNLKIEAIQLIQVTQDIAGAVPLLAGKDALLRVYGTASETNSVRPKVRISLSTGSVVSADAAEAGVRMVVEPGIMAASWNAVVPAASVQQGLDVVAEIDPENKICEANETDNRFPASGSLPVNVRTGPTLGIRFIPIRVSASGYVGAIRDDNLDAFMAYARKVHPVSRYEPDIRLVPYTTSRGGFDPNDQNGSWSGVLSELGALRVAEGSGRYYHGIVRVTYNSGIAGIGLLGGKAALTWDHMPSASEVVAHELGHNFGRFHAPCGNPGGPDAGYPSSGDYAGGKIGQVGYDFAENVLKPATEFADYMSYCRPAWTSDYTYKAVLAWLTDPRRGPTLPLAAARADEPSLLIWGRIIDGTPVLEPTFEIAAPAHVPATAGGHRLAALDGAGTELFSLAFEGERVADVPGNVETFAFAVPTSMLRGRTLAQLRLTTAGRTARSDAASNINAAPIASVVRADPRSVRVRWDASRHPMLMLRDPVTGDVLSFARGGDVTVETVRGELELHYSNRLSSARRVFQVR